MLLAVEIPPDVKRDVTGELMVKTTIKATMDNDKLMTTVRDAVVGLP